MTNRGFNVAIFGFSLQITIKVYYHTITIITIVESSIYTTAVQITLLHNEIAQRRPKVISRSTILNVLVVTTENTLLK